MLTFAYICKNQKSNEPDVKLGSQVAVASQHRFSERTLQIFLKEMRLALKDDNHNEVSNKLLQF